MSVNVNITPAIREAGYGMDKAFTTPGAPDGVMDGIPRTVYYTPDGRTIRTMPSLREYTKRDARGNVIESGIRDANLDRGWLLTRPEKLLPFCQTCDRWHDTQAEVAACAQEGAKFIRRMDGQVRTEQRKNKRKESDKITGLEKQIAELKAMIEQMARSKSNGTLL